MAQKPTKEEISNRLLESGVDAKTDDNYVNAITPMMFYCSNGHKWFTKLGNIVYNHQGCPYCSGRRPIVGVTDLWTTNPDIASFLLNQQDGYELTAGSGRRMDFICPNCGVISNHIVANMCRRGFSCPVCSDGVSYPNKFMASCLEQLKINYKPEYVIAGANYRYDFYLKEYNIIIEMHGKQHYAEWYRIGQTLEEIQSNDCAKKEFALNNGVANYVIIDARHSDIKYISSNIKNSVLCSIFDLTIIDWLKCGSYAAGSLIYKTAELYNIGNNVQLIATMLNVDTTTVYHWLKKATELGLCNWIKNTGFLKQKRKIILLNTKEVFDSVSDGSRKYSVSISNISSVCRKQRAYAGIHPDTNEPMVWRYIEDYNDNENIDFKSLLNPHVNYRKSTKNNKEE